MKIAIADDDPKRSHKIKNLLINECNLIESDIEIFHTTQSIKDALRNIYFDIMFLDVIMPRRDETPSAMTSFRLLKELESNIKIKKPDTIIGITASTEDFQDFRSEFDKRCFTLIEARRTSSNWQEKIVSAVKYKQSNRLGRSTTDKAIYCYTIHGIRTRGAWQQDLKKIVQKNVDNVEFGTFKYGYFSIFSFFLPFLRWPAVNSFASSLDEVLEKNKEKRIILFSHSFGTHILIKALEKLVKKKEYKNLSTIVLSGSVLRRNYSFRNIQKQTNARIINDCGSSDYILSLSEAFVPFSGMAGKVGFKGKNDSTFINRIFDGGGHSHYFDQDGYFIETYWLPLFYEDYEVEMIDNRKDSFFRLGLLDKTTTLLGAFKEFIYILFILWGIYIFFS